MPARFSERRTCSRYRCGIASRAAISWIGIRSRSRWSARSSTALIAYSPFAEMRTALLARLEPAFDRAHGVLREVGDHDVRARALDRDQRLHQRAPLVEPAEPARGADHRVLARDRVGGER